MSEPGSAIVALALLLAIFVLAYGADKRLDRLEDRIDQLEEQIEAPHD